MRIVTNNQPRPIISWHDLTESEKTEFDYLEQDNTESFFRYKGWVFCLSEFTRSDGADVWDGYSAQSAWDAVLIKIVDNETVIVGRAFW